MACGLPVIVTDRCGSIGDIVQENDNAFIYPAGDVAALRDALDAMVSDDNLRSRMESAHAPSARIGTSRAASQVCGRCSSG